MFMLITNQLMMVCGMTVSMADANSFEKFFFLFMGWLWMCIIFQCAFQIFREAVVTMPWKGKTHIYRMAACFFISWFGYSIFFALGPEGMNWVSFLPTQAGYAAMDILAKPVFAWHGWHLRWNILRKLDNPNEFVSSNLFAGRSGVAEDFNKHRTDVYRILLIEKDEVFAYFFYNILFCQQNCEVQRAKNVMETMSKLEATKDTATKKSDEYPYDMILVNFDMAEKNCFSLVKDIRKKEKEGSIPIVCYGRNIPEEAMYTKNGVDDWLLPPFPDADIQSKMRTWIRRMAAHQPEAGLGDKWKLRDCMASFQHELEDIAWSPKLSTQEDMHIEKQPNHKQSVGSAKQTWHYNSYEEDCEADGLGTERIIYDQEGSTNERNDVEWAEPSERFGRLGVTQRDRVVVHQSLPADYVATRVNVDSLNHQVEKLIQRLEVVKRTSTPTVPRASVISSVPELS
mmetsp:Transcript_32185/g.60471  ORF Transcript_32185/g.60471 Transcript_32185/m.60471 type:complete len:456 (-) Transcript_32185:236-1603(-)